MEPVTIIAFYFILWWLTLFTILPIGVKTQDEEEDVTLGTVASAPTKPMLLKKVIATTIISALILALAYYVIAVLGFTWDDIPFLPEIEPVT